jgi:tRNA (adenine22-N1)-methyltransferase
MQTVPTPPARLCSALPYLKKGGAVIDVGTDHAYLPIYLVGQHISSRALACDINLGPIESAERNIAAAHLSKKIATLCTDGLHGAEEFGADDVLIFGMGGELIMRILSEAPWVKNASIGLVLQPMTRAHVLRAWLLENGFEIVGEAITHEDRRYYQTVAARYCGKKGEYSEEELLLGRLNIQNKTPHLKGFIEHEIGVWEAIRRGKAASKTGDTSDEDRVLQFLKDRLENLK